MLNKHNAHKQGSNAPFGGISVKYKKLTSAFNEISFINCAEAEYIHILHTFISMAMTCSLFYDLREAI